MSHRLAAPADTTVPSSYPSSGETRHGGDDDDNSKDTARGVGAGGSQILSAGGVAVKDSSSAARIPSRPKRAKSLEVESK